MRKIIIRWPVVIAVCVALLAGFALGMISNAGMARSALKEEEALQSALTRKEQSVLEKRRAIGSVGSDSFLEMSARLDYDYVKPGELRFEVRNEDLLQNYTDEEIQILANEMAQPDR